MHWLKFRPRAHERRDHHIVIETQIQNQTQTQIKTQIEIQATSTWAKRSPHCRHESKRSKRVEGKLPGHNPDVTQIFSNIYFAPLCIWRFLKNVCTAKQTKNTEYDDEFVIHCCDLYHLNTTCTCIHSWKKCFCLREPVFWGRIFLIWRRNFPNME